MFLGWGLCDIFYGCLDEIVWMFKGGLLFCFLRIVFGGNGIYSVMGV